MKERLRIVATGGSGFVGSTVFRKDVIDLPGVLLPSSTELNVCDIGSVSHFVHSSEAGFVIHSAGYTDVQNAKANYKGAKAINAEGTKNIAKVCEEIGIPMILISTDMVFPGNGQKKGPYKEDSRRPESFTSISLGSYASTKLEAEQVAEEHCSRLSIVRISYPFGSGGPKDYISKLINRMQSGGQVFSDQIITPTFLPDLATTLNSIVNNGINGIFHVATEPTTPFEVANYLVAKLKLPYTVIEGSCANYLRNPKVEPIPLYGGLDTEKTRKTLGVNFHTWKEAVGIMLS